MTCLQPFHASKRLPASSSLSAQWARCMHLQTHQGTLTKSTAYVGMRSDSRGNKRLNSKWLLSNPCSITIAGVSALYDAICCGLGPAKAVSTGVDNPGTLNGMRLIPSSRTRAAGSCIWHACSEGRNAGKVLGVARALCRESKECHQD